MILFYYEGAFSVKEAKTDDYLGDLLNIDGMVNQLYQSFSSKCYFNKVLFVE